MNDIVDYILGDTIIDGLVHKLENAISNGADTYTIDDIEMKAIIAFYREHEGT